jgi:hypothetical protein
MAKIMTRLGETPLDTNVCLLSIALPYHLLHLTPKSAGEDEHVPLPL